MTLPIDELCDYYLDSYPVKGDCLTADDIAEDAKVLATHINFLRTALEYIRDMGMDCPAAMEPKDFYRNGMMAMVGLAARTVE